MTNLSWASVDLTALHFDPIMDEGWHEHTFTVSIWWPAEPWRDGRAMQAALDTLLRTLAPEDEKGIRRLAPENWSNEAIARACLTLGNVVRVTVSRPGFGVDFSA